MSLRLDMLVLFLWAMTGLVTAAFYTYAAALLLSRTLAVEDIRPVGALLGLQAGGLVLLCNFDSDMILTAVRLVYDWGCVLFLVPLGLICGWSLVHGRRS